MAIDFVVSFCLSNALHSSIGQNIKSLAYPVSDVRSPMSGQSGVRSECEQLQMAITQQRVIRSTSCLVLGCFGSSFV